LESCYAKPGVWAITDQNMALEGEPSFAQQQKSDKCHVTFDMKWVPEGSPMLDDAHPTSTDLETEKIFKTVQSEYSDDIIKGRLRISMSHARDLTSPDGSKKSVNHPYASFTIYNTVIESEAWKGDDHLNPVWDVYDVIDIEAPRKNLISMFVEVHDAYQDQNRFMGCAKIPMKTVFCKPAVWAINGYINLTEKDTNLNPSNNKTKVGDDALEHKFSVGKVYLQFKWIPHGYKDNDQDAPIVEYNK
jgi:hypothetical protein